MFKKCLTLKTLKTPFQCAGIARGKNREAYPLKEGDSVGQFALKNKIFFPDEKITLFHLLHQKLGTNYYHFDCEDENNAFGLIFKTWPQNSKGVPHILEHVALCGSEKFPVKDPFFKMERRSLNSYMNAWTGPDFTMYPFSTRNSQDFSNLLNVYCDSAFNMLLKKQDFQQEGWRLDFDEENKLMFKGVVFNEMKGCYQNQDSFFHQKMMQLLLAGTFNQYDSGGDPLQIPSLSYEEFLSFSKQYYHPSNCNLASYGDLDFRKHIEFIEENYLKNYERREMVFETQKTKLSCPETVEITGPSEAMELKENFNAQVCLSFLFGEIEEQIDYLGLNVLTLLLFEYPNSVFQKEILEKEIAGGYSAAYGLEANCSFPFFSIGFKGVQNEPKNLESLKKLILDLLKQISEEGFEDDFLSSVLHQVELTGKEGRSNKGIQMFEHFFHSLNERSLNQFGVYLNLTESLQLIKEKEKNEQYFQNLIKKYLLNNQRQQYVVLRPDEEFLNNQTKSERELLRKIEDALTEEKRKAIQEENECLLRYQNAVQDLDVLPSLKIEDIPETVEETKIKTVSIEGTQVHFVNDVPKGLTTVRMKIDITNFPPSMSNYLFLLQKFMTQLGTSEFSHEDFAKKVNNITSGINIVNNCHQEFDGQGRVRHFISFETKCLDRNIEKTFNLLSHFLREIKFHDFKRLSQLIQLEGAEAANSLSNNSHSFAVSVAKGAVNQASNFNNTFRNTKFLADYSSKFLKGVHSRDYLEDLSFQLDSLKTQALKRERISFMVHTEENNVPLVEKMTKVFLMELDSKYKYFNQVEEVVPHEEFQPFFIKQYFSVPSYVNYVVETFQAPFYMHEEYAKLQVATQMLQLNLHKLVREKGGAYGSFVNLENRSLSISSYRDPNYLQTYLAFEEAVKLVVDGGFTETEIDGGKLKLFQSIDAIRKPEDQGLGHFYYKQSHENFLKYRQQCLRVGKEEIQEVVKKYIYDPLLEDKSAKVIFGSDQNNLEGLVSRGWKINKFTDVFAYSKQS